MLGRDVRHIRLFGRLCVSLSRQYRNPEKKTLGRLIEATIRFGLPAHMEGKDFR